MADREVATILREHKILGDVLDCGIQSLRNLRVQWPSVTLNYPGQMLDREAVQTTPECFVEPPPSETVAKADYVLLMVDPDLTMYHDTKFGQVRHWLVVKCFISDEGKIEYEKGVQISPYVGPAPLPAHLITGKARPSRYTFILCRHTSGEAPQTYNIDLLKWRDEGDVTDLGGASQNMIDRMRFNTQQFLVKNSLEVVAATFMFIEGNVKSGIANATLLATGLAQKAVGK